MSYNWGFSTYGQREKLKKIKGGDADLYNSEKELNEKSRQSYREVGLSTADIDNWDMLIDNAWNTRDTGSSRALLPKIDNSRLAAVNAAFQKADNLIKQERKQALEDAESEAETAYSQLSEWLANNGFSDEGYTAKTSKKELEESYKKLISDIKREFSNLRKETKDKYFSAYLR